MVRSYLFLGCILCFFLSGCQSAKDSSDNTEEHPVKLLSQEDNASEDSTVMDEIPGNELGYGIPNTNPTQQHEAQILVDQPVQLLPFADFKARWNAISNEQGSDLMISSLQTVTANNETYYRVSLPRSIQLSIFTMKNQVKSLQMTSNGKSSADRLSMLTGWSQIAYVLNPNMEPHHIDTLFSELGVGPNTNLTEVGEHSVVLDDIEYTVIPLENGYTFKATYIHDVVS